MVVAKLDLPGLPRLMNSRPAAVVCAAARHHPNDQRAVAGLLPACVLRPGRASEVSRVGLTSSPIVCMVGNEGQRKPFTGLASLHTRLSVFFRKGERSPDPFTNVRFELKLRTRGQVRLLFRNAFVNRQPAA